MGGSPTDSRHEKRIGSAGRGASACGHTCCEVAEQVEVHVCIAVGGSPTDRRHEKRSGSAGRGAGVGIVVDAFATCSRHEKRSRGAGRGAGVGIFLDAFTTDSRYEKRIGSAGRGTQVHCAQLWVGGLRIVGTTSEAVAQVENTRPCMHRCGWAGYGS